MRQRLTFQNHPSARVLTSDPLVGTCRVRLEYLDKDVGFGHGPSQGLGLQRNSLPS